MMTFASKQQKLSLLVLCIGALLAGPLSAFANSTWIGGAGINWNTPANWSSGAVPGAGDNVTIPSGLATYPVVSAAGAVCSQINFDGKTTPAPSLTIVNGGSLTSGGNLTMAPGASIVIHTGGTFTLNADCNNSGQGLLTMDGGTFVFNGNNLFVQANLTGGTVDITHSNPHVGVTSFYNLVYSGGSPPFTLAGNTTVSGNFDITSGSRVAINGYNVSANTLTLGGTTEIAGGYNNNNASAYISGTSTQVTVSAGPPVQLVFTTQPANTMAGKTMPGMPVQIQDASGNNIASANVTVTVSLNNAAFAGGNTTTNTSASGSAAFNNLVINAPGSHTMTASAPGLTSAISGTFTVAPLELGSACAAANGHNQFIMRWLTISGKTYQVQCSTNLLVSSWTPIGNPVAGTGAVICVTNNLTGVPQCFFRLQMQ